MDIKLGGVQSSLSQADPINRIKFICHSIGSGFTKFGFENDNFLFKC